MMKILYVASFILALGWDSFHNSSSNDYRLDENQKIIGIWVRIGTTGPMAIEFTEDGKAKVDFGNDGSVDVSSKYQLSGQRITFIDQEGAMCHEPGQYMVSCNNYYAYFDLVKDNCGGRIKSTMGYWTRSGFKQLLGELDVKITLDSIPESLLSRARIFLAIGESAKAKADLDDYIAQNDSDAKAYLNRAASKMPKDLTGVVADCSKSLRLDPNNKNAFFLRGLARYELGEEELGCEDFEKAIELGFSVLRIAEQQKCKAFWSDQHQ